MNTNSAQPSVQLVVLDDDQAALDYARALVAADVPVGVVSASYPLVIPFLISNRGLTAAVVADVDDPDQLASAIHRVEQKLGRVSAVIRYASDIPAVAKVAPIAA